MTYKLLPDVDSYSGPTCSDVVFGNKRDCLDLTNIFTKGSWSKICEKVDVQNSTLYFIGSPHPAELDYITNHLLITTVIYEYRKSLCDVIKAIKQITFRQFDYELEVPSRDELMVMKNIFFTKESKSILKFITWTYYLCHFKIPCNIIGDEDIFLPLIEDSKRWKKIIRLKYDPKKRDLCCISLNTSVIQFNFDCLFSIEIILI